MKAAIVLKAGKNPIYGDFPEPTPGNGEFRISVTASALSNLTKERALGTHYSSSRQFPFVVGVDGVGQLDDGRRIYFVLPKAPYGGMAERTVAQSSHCIVLPDEIDDITASAIANPGMSSWAALKERAKLSKGEVVLINGATGVAGSLAIQVAKYMGASKVIATGRNPEGLKSLLDQGADVTIPLNQDESALEEAFKKQVANDGIDVVLDYLWGYSAEKLLMVIAKESKASVPIRFIQIGTISGSNINLPGAILRSSAIELMGSGIGSISFERFVSAIREVFQAVKLGKLNMSTQAVPLAQVEQTWSIETESRIVFTIGGEHS